MSDSEKSGRITLRMDPKVHTDLVALAQRLGMDLNGIINYSVRRALPLLVGEAVAAEASFVKAEAARLRVPEDCLDLVLIACDAARGVPKVRERLAAVKRAIREVRKLDEHAEQAVISAAYRELRDLRDFIDRSAEELGGGPDDPDIHP